MNYNISIDQARAIEFGINQNQAALMSVMTTLSTWADPITISGTVWYFCSRNKIVKDLPLFYKKPDTVYRAYLVLEEKGLIYYEKLGNKDLIRISEKGKKWNQTKDSDPSEHSEIDPSKLGNRSESNSEIDPTDHITNIDPITKDHIINWKNDFETYKKELKEAYIELINDRQFINEQERYSPSLDIKLTLEKSCKNYWATEEAWERKRKQKIKTINWKSTLTKSLSSNLNKVYKPRDQQQAQPTLYKPDPRFPRLD